MFFLIVLNHNTTQMPKKNKKNKRFGKGRPLDPVVFPKNPQSKTVEELGMWMSSHTASIDEDPTTLTPCDQEPLDAIEYLRMMKKYTKEDLIGQAIRYEAMVGREAAGKEITDGKLSVGDASSLLMMKARSDANELRFSGDWRNKIELNDAFESKSMHGMPSVVQKIVEAFPLKIPHRVSSGFVSTDKIRGTGIFDVKNSRLIKDIVGYLLTSKKNVQLHFESLGVPSSVSKGFGIIFHQISVIKMASKYWFAPDRIDALFMMSQMM